MIKKKGGGGSHCSLRKWNIWNSLFQNYPLDPSSPSPSSEIMWNNELYSDIKFVYSALNSWIWNNRKRNLILFCMHQTVHYSCHYVAFSHFLLGERTHRKTLNKKFVVIKNSNYVFRYVYELQNLCFLLF